MYTTKRPIARSVILILILVSIILTACGGSVANTNWPGLTAKEDVVYAAFGPAIVAVDIASREQLWLYSPESGGTVQFYAAPSILDNQITFGDYGKSGGFLNPRAVVSVYMLEESDGKVQEAWKQSTIAQDRIIAPTLQVGDRVFVGTADNIIAALAADQGGAPVWPNVVETEHSIWGKPVYEAGVLYVPSLDRYVYALDAENGSVLWRTNVGGSVSDQVVLNGDLLYASSFDNNLYALDKVTGEVRWTVPAKAALWGAPAFDGESVYFVDLIGNVYAADAVTGDLSWEVGFSEYVVAAPVVSDGVIYIATGGDLNLPPSERTGEIIALDTATGEKIWDETTPAPLFSTPVIAAGSIVVAMQGQDLPLLMTYDLEDPGSSWSFTPTGQS